MKLPLSVKFSNGLTLEKIEFYYQHPFPLMNLLLVFINKIILGFLRKHQSTANNDIFYG